MVRARVRVGVEVGVGVGVRVRVRVRVRVKARVRCLSPPGGASPAAAAPLKRLHVVLLALSGDRS